jgi:hypothetical protein
LSTVGTVLGLFHAAGSGSAAEVINAIIKYRVDINTHKIMSHFVTLRASLSREKLSSSATQKMKAGIKVVGENGWHVEFNFIILKLTYSVSSF